MKFGFQKCFFGLLIFIGGAHEVAAVPRFTGPQKKVEYEKTPGELKVTLSISNISGPLRVSTPQFPNRVMSVEQQNGGRRLVLKINTFSDIAQLKRLQGLSFRAHDRTGTSTYRFPGIQFRVPAPLIMPPQVIFDRPTDPARLADMIQKFKDTGELRYGQIYFKFYPEHARLFAKPIEMIQGMDAAYQIMARQSGLKPFGGKPMGFVEKCPFLDPELPEDQRLREYNGWKARNPATGALLREDCPNGHMIAQFYAQAKDPINVREGTVELARTANLQQVPTLHLILLHEMAHHFDRITDEDENTYHPMPAHLFSYPAQEAWADIKVVALVDELVKQSGGTGVRQWEQNFYTSDALKAWYLRFESEAYSQKKWSFDELHTVPPHGRIYGRSGSWQAHEVFSGSLLKIADQFGDHASSLLKVLATERQYPRQLVGDWRHGITEDESRVGGFYPNSAQSRLKLFNAFMFTLTAATGRNYAQAFKDQYGYPVLDETLTAGQAQAPFKDRLYGLLRAMKVGFYEE